MNKIIKLELAMTLIALIVCGTFYGIWRVQTSEDNLVPSTPVQKVEKKQRAEKPAEALPKKQDGIDVKGRVNVSIDNE